MKLYMVTYNIHKLEEASAALRQYGIRVEPPPRGIAKLEVQGDSLEEIALTAARHAYLRLLSPLVVEDAGLFIHALRGFPGPYSSYVYRTLGVDGVLRAMEGVESRDAYFKSAVACIYPPYEEVFVGVVEGAISREARGHEGFGFDPIFVPRGSTRTFAEMGLEEKNRISHRAKAFHALAGWLAGLHGGKLKEPQPLSG